MKRWVFTWRVAPPVNQTISVRFGSSVMFGAYSKFLDQWYMVVPGGTFEKIAEPPMFFCDEEWAATHKRDFAEHPRRENPLRIRARKVEQLTFL
jgi:hypothetical protein